MEMIPPLSAGVAQMVIGHPIDTVKTLIQNKMPWNNLSMKGYYRGYQAPFLMSLGFNSIVFPSHEYFYKKTGSHALSGAVSGVIVTPVVYVSEVVKIGQQTGSNDKYKPFRTMRGLGSLFVRETAALSIYFSSFYFFKDRGHNSFVAGGASGFLNWGITYPADVVKTRIIAQDISLKEAVKQGNLHRGIGFTLLRAVLVNSCIFHTYETTSQWVKDCKS
jgi:hypothetical protein